MNTDGRRLDHKTLTELRKRAIASVQTGEKPWAVAGALGVNLRTVFRWLALYRSGGWGKLDARKRGGRRPKLDGEELKWVYDTVVEKSPMQFNQRLQKPSSVRFSRMVVDHNTAAGAFSKRPLSPDLDIFFPPVRLESLD